VITKQARYQGNRLRLRLNYWSEPHPAPGINNSQEPLMTIFIRAIVPTFRAGRGP
jgi:hypothetical protein